MSSHVIVSLFLFLGFVLGFFFLGGGGRGGWLFLHEFQMLTLSLQHALQKSRTPDHLKQKHPDALIILSGCISWHTNMWEKCSSYFMTLSGQRPLKWFGSLKYIVEYDDSQFGEKFDVCTTKCKYTHNQTHYFPYPIPQDLHITIYKILSGSQLIWVEQDMLLKHVGPMNCSLISHFILSVQYSIGTECCLYDLMKHTHKKRKQNVV